VALGAGSVANGSTLGNAAYLVGGAATGEVNIGDRRITGVSAGAEDTDAVNVSQLKAVDGKLDDLSDVAVKYDTNPDGSINYNNITLGGDTYNSVTKTGGTKITNVARGVDDSDAVNMSQLNETNANIANMGDTINNFAGDQTDTYTTVNGRGIRYVRTNDAGLPESDAFAQGTGSTAVGYEATSTGVNSFAAGNKAEANGVSTIAIGDGAGQGSTGDVNIAMGLNAGQNVTGNNNQAFGNGAGGNVKGWDNQAAGFMAGTDVTGNYNQSSGSGAGQRVTGDRNLAFGASAGNDVTASDTVAVGSWAKASADNSVAIGTYANASAPNSVALGAGSIANGSTLGNAAYLVGGSANGEVNIGDRRITGVSAGAEDTDAVNVSQLKAVDGKLDSLSDAAVKYGTNPDGSVNYNNITLSGDTYNSITKTGGTKITNVARGVDDGDAVNMSQLNEVSGDLTNLGDTFNSIAGDTSNEYVTKNGRGIKYVRTNDAGLDASDAFAQGQGSTAVGYNATTAVQATNALALGNGASAMYANSVALGSGSVATGATLGQQAYLVGGTASSEVNIGNRRITGLSAGAADTDAVNVSQLKAVQSQVAQTDSSAVKYDDSTHNHITLGGAGGTTITNVAAGNIAAGSTDAVNGGQLYDTNQRIDNINNYFDNSVHALQTGQAYFQADGKNDGTDNAVVDPGTHGVAMGPNARVKGNNSVALGANSVADRDNTVSVGTAGNERQITNVAAGTQLTDAVNLGQLNDGNANTLNQANSYTDSKLGGVSRDANAGTAAAMAMAGLPQSVIPGKGMIAAAGSNYSGQSAMALGASLLSDSGRWAYKATASVNTRGKYGVTVGAGMHW
jgi:autotransporter adhesin